MLRIHFIENGKMKIELSILTPKRKSVVLLFANTGERNNVEKEKRNAIMRSVLCS